MLTSLRERLGEARKAFSAVFTNPGLRRLELSWTGTVCAYWIFIGPAVGGLLLAATGTDVVFASTAAVFLVSAFLLVGVRGTRGASTAGVRSGFLREALAGYGTVARDARLRLVIGLYGAQTLVA